MKIAYLLGSLNRGGTEMLLLDVFKNANKAGFEFIGIHRKGGALKDDFYATEPEMYKLSPKFSFDIHNIYQLRKLLKKEKVDIVHAQQSLDAVYARIASLGTPIKIVQTQHGYDNFIGGRDKLMTLAFKLTDKNIFVSNYQRKYFTKKYNLNPNKQVTVYNGISFEKLDNEYETPDFLKKYDPTLRGIQICMVGNFVSVRDQSTVCRFLKLLKDSGTVFDFYFVGKRDENEPWRYDTCVRYCQENNLEKSVHFLGSRNDVSAILHNIDAFVYSTAHDSFGIAVVEAIAVGVSVFVNDWEVMREITESGSLASLYKSGDEQNLFDKFQHFLQDRNLFQQKSTQAKKIVRERYCIENHILNLNQVYNELLKK